MTPEQREAAMDELSRLDKLIANISDDIDPGDPECEWQESIMDDLRDAVRQRDLLLLTFPEVRYWPEKSK